MSSKQRRLPLAIALGLGVIALLWGLATLEGIVIDERHTARESIASQEAALVEYARHALEQELSEALLERSPRFEAAMEDPFAPAKDLLLLEGGRQRLPPLPEAGPVEGTPARALYDRLRAGGIPDGLEPGSPPLRRVELLLELRDAIGRHATAEIEATTYALLRHRVAFVLDSAFDIPLTVAMLDDFAERSTPSNELMASLLRKGIGTDPDANLDALQRKLLRRRLRFSAADFEFLAARIEALSRAAGVEVDDFVAAARPPVDMPVPAGTTIDAPALVDAGRYYAAPHSESQVRGMEIDLVARLAAIERDMQQRGLLEDDDHLRPPEPTVHAPLATLPLGLAAPRLQRARAVAEDRFWLKTTFVAGSAGLVLVIVVLSVLLQRRRQRFVELKSDFVATVSHELRTPLASIRLMAETLQRRTRDVPAARDYPQRIVRDIDELSFLVENILSFNRLDKGRWEPRRSNVTLLPLLHEVLDELASYGYADVELHTEGLDAVVLHGDRELLKLLLRNLAKNACTYNERKPVELEVTGRLDGDRFVVEFADNGIGIPADARARIFEDFQRGTGTRARGSGLGLSICRKTMQAHGGRIRIVESSPAGTRFSIELPGSMLRAAP